MRKSFLTAAVLFFLVIFLFNSCTDKSYDIKPSPVTLDLTTISQDPYFNLGRVLFYDNNISVNSSISCGSCHKQALAFSDNVPFSRGFENRLTVRNTLPIVDLVTSFSDSTKLFWDGRAKHLSELVLQPILNHVEMGMGTEDDILNRVMGLAYYAPLLEDLETDLISPGTIAYALAAFVGSIATHNTRFDDFLMNRIELTAIEQQGHQLFQTKYNCNSCHQAGISNYYSDKIGGFENIGLEENSTDKGRYNVTSNPADIGKFKVPSLRNIALTAPYMHDGRFETLEEVLDHYSHNIENSPTLSNSLKDTDGNPIRMNISDQEKTAIIAFLHTLTDYELLSSPKLKDPFVH